MTVLVVKAIEIVGDIDDTFISEGFDVGADVGSSVSFLHTAFNTFGIAS